MIVLILIYWQTVIILLPQAMSTNNYGQDSLDQQRELLQYKMHKHRRSHFLNPQRDSLNQQDLVYKNFYKQQLDDLVRQKN